MKRDLFPFVFCLISSTLTSVLATATVGYSQAEPVRNIGGNTPDSNASGNDLAGGQIVFNAPTPPRQGTPGGRSQGGASRGPCQKYQNLAALVPTTEGMVWGKTTEATPSLWFYLPQDLTAETPMEFTLQDADDNYIYNATLEAPDIPAGLIHFEVDPEAQSLQPDQLYTWTLVIYCDPAQPTESVFVNGTLQPTALNSALQSQLAAADGLDRAKLYAANGIWYDALDTLADSQQTQPTHPQLTTAWEDLLRQAGLSEFTTQSFSPCCSF